MTHALLPADCIDDLRDPRLKRLHEYWRGCCGAAASLRLTSFTAERLRTALRTSANAFLPSETRPTRPAYPGHP